MMKSSISECLGYYKKHVTEEFISELLSLYNLPFRKFPIFKPSVVIWLMLYQRLQKGSDLSSAIEHLKSDHCEEIIFESKRTLVNKERISNSTGGYSKARTRLKEELVYAVVDRLNGEIAEQLNQKTNSSRDSSVYLLDGSTFRISHTEENLETYPASENQHGRAHYPTVKFSVLINARTGAALRPAIGAYTGSKSVSEIGLGEELIGRLPTPSIIVGDRYYGIFNFVHLSNRAGHKVVYRIKKSMFKSITGCLPKAQYGCQKVVWKPTAGTKSSHGYTDEDAISGQVVWFPSPAKGKKKEVIMLFSTTNLSPEKVVELYGYRWDVETDLRQIKSTLKASFISVKTPEMVRKEMVIAITAYNLIRLFMGVLAKNQKVDVRRMSFSRVLTWFLHAVIPTFHSENDREIDWKLLSLEKNIKYYMIPKTRKKKPSEPRKIWPKVKQTSFAAGESRENERKKLRK